MNMVNFLDGLDGLAAGVCAIAGFTFALIALSLGKPAAAAFSAIVLGATLGFLRHNFFPARIFMGDSGAMLLGFSLAAVSVEGLLKTAATVALFFPLLVLAVPILDTGFVVARRLKYRHADHRPGPSAPSPPVREHRLLAAAGRALHLLLGRRRLPPRRSARATSRSARRPLARRGRPWEPPGSACSPSAPRSTWSTCSRSSSSPTRGSAAAGWRRRSGSGARPSNLDLPEAAVTVPVPRSDTTQIGRDPLQRPPQPAKTNPRAGLDSSVTEVPRAKGAAQRFPHAMPAGLLVTAPDPVRRTSAASTLSRKRDDRIVEVRGSVDASAVQAHRQRRRPLQSVGRRAAVAGRADAAGAASEPGRRSPPVSARRPRSSPGRRLLSTSRGRGSPRPARARGRWCRTAPPDRYGGRVPASSPTLRRDSWCTLLRRWVARALHRDLGRRTPRQRRGLRHRSRSGGGGGDQAAIRVIASPVARPRPLASEQSDRPLSISSRVATHGRSLPGWLSVPEADRAKTAIAS